METEAINPCNSNVLCESPPVTQSDIESWLFKGVIFSYKPGLVLIAWGNSHWHQTPQEDRSNWFYFPDFFLSDSHPWLQFENSAIIPINELIALLENFFLDEPSTIKWENPSKELFEKGFHELQGLFLCESLEKVVHYGIARSPVTLTPAHRKAALNSILIYIQNAPAFAYGFWNDSEGILGATPELLFRLQCGPTSLLHTMALAGTQKSDAFSHQMLKDKKLLHEHNIVVEDIVQRLTKHSKHGQINIGQLEVLSLPLLSHLYTPISCELNQQENFSSLVSLLHPTPSLGGRPRELVQKWLLNYNTILPRGRFGAPVGFWDSHANEHVCYVAIRNVMWDKNEIMMGVGGGNIAESDLEMEWQELLLKKESIIKLLNL